MLKIIKPSGHTAVGTAAPFRVDLHSRLVPRSKSLDAVS